MSQSGSPARRACGRSIHPRPVAWHPAPRAPRRYPRPTSACRRLLIFASLALNIADPLVTGAYGKAAFDAVGPLLLIGWAEVGPGILQAIATAFDAAPFSSSAGHRGPDAPAHEPAAREGDTNSATSTSPTSAEIDDTSTEATAEASANEDLLNRARHADAQHWIDHGRSISADTLRRNLRISTARARLLVSIIRAEQSHRSRQRSRGLLIGGGVTTSFGKGSRLTVRPVDDERRPERSQPARTASKAAVPQSSSHLDEWQVLVDSLVVVGNEGLAP